MSDLLSISSTAVMAYQRALGTVSNNIANVGTEGYARQDISLTANTPSKQGTVYIGNGVRFEGVKRQVDSFIDSNLRNSQSDLANQTPMLNYANRVVDIMGGEQTGLTTALNRFFDASRDLSGDPSSTVQRAAFLRESEGLTSSFRELSGQLQLIDDETREATTARLGEFNTLVSQLGLVNNQLAKNKTESKQPTELLDQRDRLLNSISELSRITTKFEASGAVSVSLGSSMQQGLVLEGENAKAVTASFSASEPDKVDLYIGQYSAKPTTLAGLAGGQLGGLLSFREQVLNSARNALDDLAKTFVTQVNSIHKASMDAYGNPGEALFELDASATFASSGIRVRINDTLKVAAASQFRVAENPNNPSTVIASLSYAPPGQLVPADIANTLLNNASASAAKPVSISAGQPFNVLTGVAQGTQDTVIHLNDLQTGQDIQVLTREGVHIAGNTLSDAQTSMILRESYGFVEGNNYNTTYLNKAGDLAYRQADVFIGAKAATTLAQNFDDSGMPINGTQQQAVLTSSAISGNLTGKVIAAGALEINGIALGELRASGTTLQASEIATWLNTARPSEITPSSDGKAIVSSANIKLDTPLRFTGKSGDILTITPPTSNGTVQQSTAVKNVLAVKEVATLSVDAALTNGQTITYGGLSYAAGAGGATASEAVDELYKFAAFGTAGVKGTVTGTLDVNYAVGVGTPTSKLVFTAVNTGTQVDLTAPTGTAATSAVVGTQGTTPVKQIDSISFDNEFVVGQGVTLNVGGKPVTLTVKAEHIGLTPEITRANITSALSSAFNASTDTAHTGVTASVANGSATTVAANSQAATYQYAFGDIAANETITLAGLTFTAGASGARSTDLAAAFATGATGTFVRGKLTGALTAHLAVEPVGGVGNQVKLTALSTGTPTPTPGASTGSAAAISPTVTAAGAAARAETTFTLTGTFVAGQDVSILLNKTPTSAGSVVSYKVSGADIGATDALTQANVAAKLAAAYNASAITAVAANTATATTNTIKIQADANSTPFVATFEADSGVVMLTADTAGTPFTATVSQIAPTSFASSQGLVDAINARTAVHLVSAEINRDGALVLSNIAKAEWLSAMDGMQVRAFTEVTAPSVGIKLTANLTIRGNGGSEIALTAPSGGHASKAALVDAINAQRYVSQVQASLSANGDLVLTNIEGSEGDSITIGPKDLVGVSENALGLNVGASAKTFGGQFEITRSLANPKENDIRIGFGANGAATDLQSLGLRAGVHIAGESADDYVVMVTGQGDFKASASYTQSTRDATAALRKEPFDVRFVDGTKYTITDRLSGTVVANRDFDPNSLPSEITFRGVTLTFTSPPSAGDHFGVDGNQDGVGDNKGVLRLVALESAQVMPGQKTITETYIDQVSSVGNIAQRALVAKDALTVVYDQALEARDTISGVSLDEEAASLIRYQQAYQASAKVMQTASTLFDAILRVG